MSITLEVFAKSPEPEAHDKVLGNNPDRIGIWKCWLLRRGENRSIWRKTSRSKDDNQQQTQPTFDAEYPGHTGGRRVLFPNFTVCSFIGWEKIHLLQLFIFSSGEPMADRNEFGKFMNKLPIPPCGLVA